jgi:hypothetical protein
MASIDKLLKYLKSYNIADMLDEEDQKEIARDVVEGYQIDEESRAQWLEMNRQAMAMIKTAERDDSKSSHKDFPFKGSAKIVYPLIGPAVIQMASRLIQHLVRNGKIGECDVLGPDQPMQNPQTGQPTGTGIKEAKAKRITDYLCYEKLVESNSWLPDMHKLCHILSSWGMAFKENYYDPVTETICSELVSPEDVIINHNISSLDKAKRITVRLYLTKNEIIERIRAGQFLDHDLSSLNTSIMNNTDAENDSRDKQPVFEILRQVCYLDLDDDDYAEPYYVFVHNYSKTLFGIYPAFELEDIKINPKGEIMYIERRCGLVDFHLIDDPEGKYYSLGLNHLLFHPSKSITTILRQLIDTGTLKNAASTTGFVTRAVKTKNRTIKAKLGEFESVDLSPDLKLSDQFFNMPFQEPSQVLASLLEVLIDNAKQTGFMTDLLTGDAETQNVPATTALAMVEQGTRAFKPVVQKLYNSLKQEFRIWFHLNSKHLDKAKYFKFQDQQQMVIQDDFDEQSIDISPVADPTMSSEAHKYARLQALFQLFQTPIAEACNIQEALTEYFKGLEFPSPELLIKPPAPPPPDPKMVQIQVDSQLRQKDQQIEILKAQNAHLIAQQKLELEQTKVGLKAQEVVNHTKESKAKIAKTIVDAHREAVGLGIDHRLADIEQQHADNDHLKIQKMSKPNE